MHSLFVTILCNAFTWFHFSYFSIGIRNIIYEQGTGNWDTISLYDENGSFRGEASFETKKEAEAYLKLYKDKINKRKNKISY